MKRPVTLLTVIMISLTLSAGNIHIRFEGARPDTLVFNAESLAEEAVGMTSVNWQRIPLSTDTLTLSVDDDETVSLTVWPLDEDTNTLTAIIAPGEDAFVTVVGGRMRNCAVSGTPLMEAISAFSKSASDYESTPELKKMERDDRFMSVYRHNYDYALAHRNEDIAVWAAMRMPLEMIALLIDSIGEKAREGILQPYYEAMQRRVAELNGRKATVKALQEHGEAPDFKLIDVNGNAICLSDYRGRWVILDFWATWCGWCLKGFPALADFQRAHSDTVTVLALSCDYHESQVEEFMKGKDFPWNTAWCDPTTEASVNPKDLYAVEAFPTKVLVAPDGHIAIYQKGENPEFLKEVARLMTR